MVTKKQAQLLRHLLGGSHVLTALSSEYSEDDEQAFIENFGATFSEAEKALEELRWLLDEKRTA